MFLYMRVISFPYFLSPFCCIIAQKSLRNMVGVGVCSWVQTSQGVIGSWYMCRKRRVIVFSSTHDGESTSLHWIISHHCQRTALLWESACLLLPAQPLPEGFPTSQSWLYSAGHNTKLKDMSVPGRNFWRKVFDESRRKTEEDGWWGQS